MTDQETSLQNAFVTTLTAEMGPVALTADATSKGNLTSPTIIVIEMESDTQREYILFDGVFGASSFVTTNIANRYLAGSAAASNLTHPVGSSVQSIAAQQHFEDLNDRIDADRVVIAALDHGDDLAGLADDDHTQYYNQSRGDARYAKVASAWFPIIFSGGKGDAQVTTVAEAFRWKAERACTLVGGTVTAGVAPTGSAITCDARKNGTTMFATTLPEVAAGSQDGTQQAPTVTAIAAGDIITGLIISVGSTTPGENVTFSLEIETP